LCKGYREEIDTLLVFAGLFSAVVTAFAIESPSGLARPVAVRINAYWFLALALSLSTALVGILCKQWVREFERSPGLSPRDFVSSRQTKFEGFEQWKVGGIIALLPLLLQLALAIFALGVLELLWKLSLTVAGAVCIPTIASMAFYTITTVLPALQPRSFDRIWHRHLRLSWWQARSQCPYKSPQALLAF
ncbi:hypothetical protein AURDEDRAFT_20255, partial [Auricularia subglabra TFB-10046 SS5]